jgi:hypothetical protein
MSLKNILIGIDQLANTLIGGSPDETLSARAWRCCWRIRPLIDKLFWFDKNHCKSSYESEQERRQLPEEYRGATK